MSYEKLKELVEKGYSTYEIAKEMNCGQTNVRYWLRKHGLNTSNQLHSRGCNDSLNGLHCQFCSVALKGKKKKFCCREHKIKFHNKIGTSTNPNTVERQKKIAKERKLKLINLKGGACKCCGYKKNFAALQFHHRDPQNKTFGLDFRKLSNTNWESILIEVEKCDLLCSNCHIETHNPDKFLE